MLLALAMHVAIAAPAGGTCEGLRSLHFTDASIDAAQSVAPGGFEPPTTGTPAGARTLSGRFKDLPAFCRVTATLRPTSDSEIKVEVWLPLSGWNGKYEGVGNPGWAGSINYPDLAEGLRRGYATSSTDTGHIGGGASFALGHPEKLIDFGYRSEHEMTVNAKAVISAFYSKAPTRSYFVGCSSGGRQGLMEAQRFPDDYDGIVAGAPTNNWTKMMFERIWVAQATLKDPASYIPPTKYPMIHQAALDVCDMLDGVKDGVIGDPPQCHFDPQVLQCKEGDRPDCLTTAQVEAARKIYTPAKNARNEEEIFPAMEPGSELVWGTLAGGPKPIALADEHFKYVVFRNPDWDFRSLNFDTDLVKAEQADSGTLSAVNPDLSRFFSHGGKLIQYHGWTDQQVQPRNSVNYRNNLIRTLGDAAVSSAYRLYMAPGMNHCGGGDGASNFDMVGAMEQWVEKGIAPDQIRATHHAEGGAEFTRPLCPYPLWAQYTGSGEASEAANFRCIARTARE
jgi:feruloyl esterase